MQELTHIGYIRELLARHGFTFQKSLGQNFLINPTVCPRMAESAVEGPGAGVLEIGPGIGVLTRELCARAERVVCIELDRRLLPVLAETLAGCGNAHVVEGDAMKLDLARIIRKELAGLRVSVAANLPYYITSPLLMRLLEERLPFTSITVMVQKEAAARLCAQPGERAAGAVSVAVHYYSEPEILFGVSRGSFLPVPNVDSAVIRLRPRARPPVAVGDEEAFFRTVRAAFAQRRKTLGNALSSGLALPKREVLARLSAGGVDATARAEALTMEEFAAAARALSSL